MTPTLELGIDTFGDVTRGADGQPLPQAEVIRQIVEHAVLADRVGVDFIGVGEHHREDFAVSAPEVVLAAIAARTTRIRMGSAVTVFVGTAYFWWRRGILGTIVSGTAVLLALKIGLGW